MKSKLLYLSICLTLFACNSEKSSYTTKDYSKQTNQTSKEVKLNNATQIVPVPEDVIEEDTEPKQEHPLLVANGPIPFDLENFFGEGPRYIPEFAEMVFAYKDSTDDKALIDVMIKHDIIYDIYIGSRNQKIEDSNPHLDDYRKLKITGSDEWYYFIDVDFDNGMYMPTMGIPFKEQFLINSKGEIVYSFEGDYTKLIHLNDPEAFTLLVHYMTPGFSGTFFLLQMHEDKMAFVSPHNNPNNELELYLTVLQGRPVTPWPNDRHLTITDVNQDGYEDLRMRCIHHSEHIDLEGILDFDTVDLDDDKYKNYIKRNYYHFEEISYLYDPRLKSYYLSQEQIPLFDSLHPFINPDRS